MEAAGLAAGKAVLNVVLGGAKGAVEADGTAKQGIQRDLPFLKEELAAMQFFLRAADDERNKVNQADLMRVRTLVYDVDDCIQEAIVHLEKPSRWQLTHTMGERQRIAEEMKRLRARIEDMGQRSLRYHIDEDPNSISATSATRGRRAAASDKPEVNQLVHLINSEDNDLKVIAVWGTSDNLEQTSIVRAAYENSAVKEKFTCRAWVRVMQPFNPIEFVQSLVRQFHAAAGVEVLLEAEKTADQLAQEFNQHVSKNGYLIVLNDLNTIEEWDRIKPCFTDSKKGSRIIVSTKQAEFATICVGQESTEMKLKELAADQILYAFHDKKAAPNQDESDRGTSLVASLERSRTMVIPMNESYLIGRSDEMHGILDLIMDGDTKLVSIWGIRGIGKTTLVRDVSKVLNAFQKCAYVKVKSPFFLEELLRSLVIQLSDNNHMAGFYGWTGKTFLKMVPLHKLIEELAMLLDEISCLIVLDDVTSIEDANEIIGVLRGMWKSSQIIITTTDEHIAKHCSEDTESIWRLNPLSYHDALYLFTKKVFGDDIDLDRHYPDLVEQAHLILSKCNGVPRAIVAMGVFLANQPKTVLLWTKLNEHINAELKMGRDLETIILNKIYDGLPYHLESCIFYLPIFPEDCKVRRRRLMRRWTAEGYSRDQPNKSAEETADTYLMDLISRSMIAPCQLSVESTEGIDSCQLDDIISQITISKSRDENFVFKLEEGCSHNTQGIMRHLAVSSNWKRDQREFESIEDLSRLRSMTVFGEWGSFFSLSKMRRLRVLDLEDTSDLVNHHLKDIGKLLHLRYLSLRGCGDIYHLPDSLGNLRQLETLDVKGTKILKLPKTISKLTKLQRVLAGFLTAKGDDRYESMYEDLPKLSSIKLSLTATGLIGGVAVPRAINKLKALLTLGTVNVSGRRKTALQDIKGFTLLRKLGVAGINRRNGRELCSAITHLRRLESLSVWSDGKNGLVGCLDHTTLPSEKLQRLKLYGRLDRLPDWILKAHNLVKLKLRGSRLHQSGDYDDDAMQVLGKLPNLAILILLENCLEGEELHFSFRNAGFPSLLVLQLQLQPQYTVEFEEGAARRLQVLRFAGYCRLDGLQNLPSIREVELSHQGRFDKYMVDGMREVLSRLPNRPTYKIV